ncbi:hypothetical protein ACFL59_05980, partial [Planctomycetota bacterium]
MGGNLLVENPSSSHTHLHMNDPNGHLTVLGNATFAGKNSLTAGTLELLGPLTQQGDVTAFQPSETTVVFAGSTVQHVSFAAPQKGRSYFDDVRIMNTAGVSFDSDVRIRGQLTLGEGAALTQGSSQTTYLEGAIPATERGRYVVPNNAVDGDIAMTEDRDLPVGASLTILASQRLRLDGHRLRVGGDLLVLNPSSSHTHLHMNQPSDHLTVVGNATFAGKNWLTAGTLEVLGDLTQQGDVTAFSPSETTVVLAGSGVQHVSFTASGSGTSYLDDVTILNTTGVSFDSDVRVTGQLTLEADAVLTQTSAWSTYFESAIPAVEPGSYLVPNSVIHGSVTMIADRALPAGADLTVSASSRLTLGGNRLTIGRDLSVKNPSSSHTHLHM